jgi:translation initiation factor 2 subunit 1
MATAIDPAQIGGNCRFYVKEYPNLEELVMVQVVQVAEMGAYVKVSLSLRGLRFALQQLQPTVRCGSGVRQSCPTSALTRALDFPFFAHAPPPTSRPSQLLEYNNIEGMILLSELSRRRIRSINKLLRIGKNEVVMVIRVDKDKGYIDLSKRRVSPEEVVKTEERFNKSKAVHSILRHVSNRMKEPIAGLYTRIGWPLTKKYGHAYDAFQLAVSDADAVFKDLDVTAEEKHEAMEHIRVKMMPQPLKIRADIQVTCFVYEGIEAIRAALLAGTATSTEAVPIKVQLIAPPLYVMFTTCLNKEQGITALSDAIAVVKGVIEARGGSLVVKMAPAVTSAHDDNELDRMMDDLDGEASGSEEEDNDDSMGAGDGAFGTGEVDYAAGLPPSRSATKDAAAPAAVKGAEKGEDGEEEEEAAPPARVAAPVVEEAGEGEYVADVSTSLAGKKKKKSASKKNDD